MKKSSFILALALLTSLSGCDEAEDKTSSFMPDTPQTAAKQKMVAEPKLSANSKPMPNPAYDGKDADEDLDATGMDAQPMPDREAEQYENDNETGLPNPEAGDPLPDERPSNEKE